MLKVWLLALAAAIPIAGPVRAQPPAAVRTSAPRVARIAAAGDLVLNALAMRAVLADPEGYDRLLSGYAAAIDESEIAYINLEQPLVNDVVPLDGGWARQSPSRPRRSPVLGATPALADALARAGVDVVSLANNHAYDQRREGLARTLEALERARLAAVGAGSTSDEAYAPRVVSQGSLRVAFVSASEAFNQRPAGTGAVAAYLGDQARVDAALARARERADVVILAVHWSRDFEPSVRGSERSLARRFVERGADVILGTGPHVLHAVERLPSPRGEAVVAYSLGNAASGMGHSYRPGRAIPRSVHPANVAGEARDGAVLHLEIAVSTTIRITRIEADALWTENNYLTHQASGEPHRVLARRLRECDASVRDARLPIVRRALGPEVTLR